MAGVPFNPLELQGAPMGLPSRNPLRMPQQIPSSAGLGSFLSALLTLPKLNLFGQTPEENPAVADIKARRNETEARAQYAKGAKELKDNPEKDQAQLDTPEDEPPVPSRNPFAGAEAENDAGANTGGAVPLGPDGRPRIPVTPPEPIADPVKSALMQIGLSLMVPQWGGTLSNIGQAVGQGAAAGGRAQQLNQAEAERVSKEARIGEESAAKIGLQKAETEKASAEAATERSGESARARRLRGKQPSVLDMAADAAGLGPKGKLYLQQRVKSINQEDLLDEDETPTSKFQTILDDAKKLDASPEGTTPAPVPQPKGTPTAGTQTVQGVPLVSSLDEAKRTLPKGAKFNIMVKGQLHEGTVP